MKNQFHRLFSVTMIGIFIFYSSLAGLSHYGYSATAPSAISDLKSDGLSLFLDWGYHYAESPYKLASKLKDGGTTNIYLSGWYRNKDYYTFTKAFIAAAHSNGINVYLWLEFPMVSEDFWNTYPEYREKTALGKDAKIDWRYLMALDHPKCFELAIADVQKLYQSFDWDGINFAELYYESPSGINTPEAMTPFNNAVATSFNQQFDKDIRTFFQKDGHLNKAITQNDLQQFLTFREQLLEQLTQKSLKAIGSILQSNQGDLILTQIDNYLDPSVAANIGIGPNYYKAIKSAYPYQLLIEDPFTLWHLEANRYTELGLFYKEQKLTPYYGVDINIVERYDNDKLLPAQSGEELMTLIQKASDTFDFVALYSANSIKDVDLLKIPSVLTKNPRISTLKPNLYLVDTKTKISFALNNNNQQILVNGAIWPAYMKNRLLLPPGQYQIQIDPTQKRTPSSFYVTEMPSRITQMKFSAYGITLNYNSIGRTFVRVNQKPSRVTLDGKPYAYKSIKDAASLGYWIPLPQGMHSVSLFR